jgi:acyl homoserine lactone synthase
METIMIIAFHGADRSSYATEADQMFRLRAKIFGDQLKWDVKVVDGWETDEFDDMNPLYLACVQDARVVGCLRLLPTTGPTLLSGPLSHLFDDDVDIRSPLIFECTRFAVDDPMMTPSRISMASAELLMSACKIMLDAGILQVMGVIDKRTLPIYRRAGGLPLTLARSIRNPNILVGLWQVSSKVLQRLIERHGFFPEIVMPWSSPDLKEAI